MNTYINNILPTTNIQQIQASMLNGQLTLTWLLPENLSSTSFIGYNIYKGSTTGGETLVASNVNKTSWTDTNIVIGQTFFYIITAESSNTSEIPISAEFSVTITLINYFFTDDYHVFGLIAIISVVILLLIYRKKIFTAWMNIKFKNLSVQSIRNDNKDSSNSSDNEQIM